MLTSIGFSDEACMSGGIKPGDAEYDAPTQGVHDLSTDDTSLYLFLLALVGGGR